jgi:hypothetical protein
MIEFGCLSKHQDESGAPCGLASNFNIDGCIAKSRLPRTKRNKDIVILNILLSFLKLQTGKNEKQKIVKLLFSKNRYHTGNTYVSYS